LCSPSDAASAATSGPSRRNRRRTALPAGESERARALRRLARVFGFERVAKLYSDAMRSLRLVEEPDLAGITDEAEAATEVAAYAAAVEAILRKEQAQWGQLTAETEVQGADKQPSHQDR
jgi:hypothetical protein